MTTLQIVITRRIASVFDEVPFLDFHSVVSVCRKDTAVKTQFCDRRYWGYFWYGSSLSAQSEPNQCHTEKIQHVAHYMHWKHAILESDLTPAVFAKSAYSHVLSLESSRHGRAYVLVFSRLHMS
jgi:hypothetical protein